MRPTVTESAAEPELVFLHTAGVHVQAFETLLRELRPQTRARHLVREDLLAAAQNPGADTQPLKTVIATTLSEIGASPGSVVLCTCSTIGGLAESATAPTGVRVIRVDRAMAEQAVAAGPRILIAAALESTLAPTEALILEAASRTAANVRITRQVVDGAWPLFEQGDFEAYLGRIAEALGRTSDCDVIVLAQASMAGAADLCPGLGVPVLSSPRLGLESALFALDAGDAQSRVR